MIQSETDESPVVLYDVETTGTSKCFDQILQFAAVKLDANWQEVDRLEVRSRLLPHIIPAPSALQITKQRIEDIVDPRAPSHYEMTRQISVTLRSWGPCIYL